MELIIAQKCALSLYSFLYDSMKNQFIRGLSLVLSLGLVGCGANTDGVETPEVTTGTESTVETTTGADTTTGDVVADVEVITLTSETLNYDGPTGAEGGENALTATLGVAADGTIQSVSVEHVASNPRSQQLQASFDAAISSHLVGQKIDSASIGTLGGASNTSANFTKALETLKTQFTANNA